VTAAIAFEKALKRWRRSWKLREIEAENPEWRDLADDWYWETTNLWLLDPENP
jgi:putative endonuclease